MGQPTSIHAPCTLGTPIHGGSPGFQANAGRARRGRPRSNLATNSAPERRRCLSPGTEFAQQAQERLTQLVDQPDAPPQRLPWLVKIFPEDKTVRPLIATSPLENARR